MSCNGCSFSGLDPKINQVVALKIKVFSRKYLTTPLNQMCIVPRQFE